MSKLSKWLRGDKTKQPGPQRFPLAFTDEDKKIHLEAQPFTMTDKDRVLALIHAVRYVVKNGIPGSIVECGVWKGGSMMSVARTLLNMGISDRELLLFDTFEGMTAPTEKDVSHKREAAIAEFQQKKFADGQGSDWCFSPLEEVKRNLQSTGYPAERTHFIKGKVEQTLPYPQAGPIALLRLDTDWYESTLAEMNHLYPLLVTGGVLIIDDYHTWQGSKQAVDEYVQRHKLRLFLAPISAGGAVAAVKP